METENPRTGKMELFYFLNNAQGTPTHIQDKDGKVVQWVQLDEYGNLEQSYGVFPEEQNYTGKKLDVESGLYYFNQRYYDPMISRFLSEDPAAQTLNPYVYSGNSPLMYVDPDGQVFQFVLMAAGAYFGGKAAYDASGGNLFATIAGALVGGYLGSEVGGSVDNFITEELGININLQARLGEFGNEIFNFDIMSTEVAGAAAGSGGAYMALRGMGGDGPALSTPSTHLDNSSRNVYAVESGYVYTKGWENPLNHNKGFGYRIYTRNDTIGFEHVYGHMEPSSIRLKAGDIVFRGQYIGKYASPTNGRSSGPHVHIGMRRIGTGGPNSWLNPGLVSPLRGGNISSPFHSIDSMHTNPHLGVDYAY